MSTPAASAASDTPAVPIAPALIAVTGATGRIGGAVATLLHEGGAPLRLLLRDPSRTPRWARDAPSVEVAVAQYDDGEAARAALAGVDVLLMVSASESADRLSQHRTFIDAAAAAGVRHVVYTSFLGAAADAVFTLARTHWATEEHLRASGMGFTLLRDSFYLDFLPDLAVDGVIAGPAGTGRVGAVAREDVARSAAAVAVRRRRHPHRRRTPHGLPSGERRGGLRLPLGLRRARLAGRRLGVDLHRHRLRRPRPRHARRRAPDRAPSARSRRAPRRPPLTPPGPARGTTRPRRRERASAVGRDAVKHTRSAH